MALELCGIEKTPLCHTAYTQMSEQDEVCYVINVFQSHVRPAQYDKYYFV